MESPARTIVALMAGTVGIAVVGNVVDAKSATPNAATKKLGQLGDSKILLGGVFAATLLTGISMAGDVGARFATGLALIAFVTSLAVYGAPVASTLDRVVGQPASAPTPQTPAAKAPAGK